MEALFLTIVLAPLFGSAIAGLLRNQVGKVGAHSVTILGVTISCVLSLYVFWQYAFNDAATYNEAVYTWMVSDGLRFEVGFFVIQRTEIHSDGSDTQQETEVTHTVNQERLHIGKDCCLTFEVETDQQV